MFWILIQLLAVLANAETTQSDLQKRVYVPSYSQEDARGVGWVPRDQKLRNVYIKLYKTSSINKYALRNAFEYYQKNNCSNSGGFFGFGEKKCCQNMDPNTIAIADYTKPSTTPRLHMINLNTGVSRDILVAHGKNSGGHSSVVTSFSNVKNSYQTPAGFHLARGTYSGDNGLSMYLHGLEERNSNSFSRYIVVHGAPYVAGGGRSEGCLAVEPKEIRSVTDQLKNNALVYNFNGEMELENKPNMRACSNAQ
jgi:hypothetical protein